MTSQTSAVSGSGVSGYTSSPAPKKEKEKTTQFVQNALVQSSLPNLGFDPRLAPTPAKKQEIVQNALSLTTGNVLKPMDIPIFKLGLSKHEVHLIDGMFKRWALMDRICLLELWALDLYTDLLQLGKYLPKEAAAEILDRFCADFAIGYVSICAEVSKEDWPVQIEFDEPGFKSSNKAFARSRKGWANELSTVKEMLQKLSSSKMRLSTVSSILQAVKKKLDLGALLLTQPEALNLLSQFNLAGLATHFPNACALNSSSPQKTLADLVQFVQFINRSFECGIKKGNLGIDARWLSRFAEKLSKISTDQNLFRDVKQLKLELAPLCFELYEMIQRLKKATDAASRGELDSTQYYQAQQVTVSSKKNKQEFTSQLYINKMTAGLHVQFFYDFCDILDEQVMEPLFPHLYVPTSTCLARFNMNLGAGLWRIKDICQDPSRKSPPMPEMSLSSVQESALKTVLSGVTSNFNFLFLPQMLKLPLSDYYENWGDFNENIPRFNYHQWLPFCQSLEPVIKVMTSAVDKLDVTRNKFLLEVEKFLLTLDREELSANREKWIHFFKEYCFQQSLDLCRWTMIAQDAKAISQLHVNLAVVNSEEDLLPEPLVDFMDLEGIEQLFSKLLTPHHPMREDLEDKPEKTQEKVEAVVQTVFAPAKPIHVEKVETKKNAQLANAPAQPRSSFSLTDAPLAPPEQPEAPRFSIRRGEKTRRILARLREMGFLPVSTRGSHLKLEDGKGQTVIVPQSGKRKQQKRGTARGISSQANGMG